MKRTAWLTVLLLLAAAWSATAAPQDPAERAFAKAEAAFNARDEAKAEAALKELQGLGVQVIPTCRQRLRTGTKIQKGLALQLLSGLGEAAAPALPEVMGATKDPDADVRGAAAWTLPEIDKSPQTVDRLAALLKDSSTVVRWKSAMGLSSLGPAAEPALPALIGACSDPDYDVSSYACGAIGDVHARPDISVPALIRALDGPVSGIATGALAKFKRDARPAVPALIELLSKAVDAGDVDWGHGIAVSIGEIGGPETPAALPALETLQGMTTAMNYQQDLADVIYKVKAIAHATSGAPAPVAPTPTTRGKAPMLVVRPETEPSVPDARTGQPLPPDGGEPGQAYLAICDGIRRNDPKALRGLGMTDEVPLPAAQAQMMLRGLTVSWPTNPSIVDGFIQGERALLHVKGVREKTTLYGTVHMEKRAGGWVIVDTAWDDKPPK